MKEIIVEKNEEDEGLIPHVWRPIFKEIVSAFVKKDYALRTGIDKVTSVSENTAEQIKEYIEDYGEELVELPEESWKTSVYIYYGEYWNLLIDLWTKAEGLSDLVLNAEVREENDGYVVKIRLVYVP
ncbi:hypothetical protein KO500_11695 [Cellulophaga baltica]|uniref:DUF7668 domain-containing protein n=1 Tax=Cellulophaga TaxID=104264 RepID=UPI001C07A06A|nr:MULTISPECIES: hypothetical protein [Cellulophaga]MBU2997102.1 hypothetical protein [Cellulophaga baltica]MDO6768500.1 hypothetical protein [Cellulophaga sp. 1_MG-2023]